MKRKLAVALLTSSLLFPTAGFAAPSQSELQPYLSEIGWSQTELEEYLDFYDSKLADYESFNDLTDFLGPVMTEENVAELLIEYELSLDEATDLLVTNGEIEEGQTLFEAYTFLDDLDLALSYYDFTPVTPEELDLLLRDYDLTLEELKTLLKENDDALENYTYIEDLDMVIYNYLYETGDIFTEFDELFSQIGFTVEEQERLFNHFSTLDFENPAFFDKIDQLANRMIAFESFDSSTELTSAQIAELLDIYQQALSLLQLDVSYSLVKDSEKKDISLEALFSMTTTDGYGLLIEFYNTEGQLLADAVLTADMFGSELITETGSDLKKAEELIKTETKPAPKHKAAEKTKEEVVTKTVKGGKLPDTASNYALNALAGLGMILSGFFIYRRFNWKTK